MAGASLPTADARLGWEALQILLRERSLLATLELMHAHLGDAFQISLPGFQPAVLVGPDHNRLALVEARERLGWRNERDPVTRLLRRGVLVLDGEAHDQVRARMAPFLHRGRVTGQVETMWRETDRVTATWPEDRPVDMLVEMRRIALLILMQTLFGIEFMPDMARLWPVILRVLDFISPGLWIVWPGMPRPGYVKARRDLDDYLYRIIRERRAGARRPDDLLSHLVETGMSDGLIRDQLLTLLIAGHDTSTASLAWALYLLGRHPQALARAHQEVERVLGDAPPSAERLHDLVFVEQVFKETLRLYPPIHVGNRLADEPLAVNGYRIPAGTRVMVSIYLSHRSATYWAHPDDFMPERFDRAERPAQPPLTYIPFGAGPRNCIGAALAQVEALVVLARLLQTFDLQLLPQPVHAHMGATLEPRPGVLMRVRRRRVRGG